MKLIKIITSFLFASLFTSLATQASFNGIHGMVLFGGNSNTYASHLPMFHQPHNYQVIFKIKVKNIFGSQTLTAYEIAKNAKKSFFTFVPRNNLDLQNLIDGKTQSFLADLYDGHFERDGKRLGPIEVQLKKTIFSAPLNSLTPKPLIEDYIVFGAAGEYYAAHIIQGKPSFDAIIEVTQPYTLSPNICHTRFCPTPKKIPLTDDRLPIYLTGPDDLQSLGISSNTTEDQPIQLGDLTSTMVDIVKIIYLEKEDLS